MLGWTARLLVWPVSVAAIIAVHPATPARQLCSPSPNLMPKPIKPETPATARNVGLARSGSDQMLRDSPVTSIMSAMKGRESMLL